MSFPAHTHDPALAKAFADMPASMHATTGFCVGVVAEIRLV